MPGALYGFAFSALSLAYLRTLPKKLRQQIVSKVKGLAENPHPPGCKKIRGMKEREEDIYRLRSGDYRVLYVVRGTTIAVLDINHRKDVYR